MTSVDWSSKLLWLCPCLDVNALGHVLCNHLMTSYVWVGCHILMTSCIWGLCYILWRHTLLRPSPHSQRLSRPLIRKDWLVSWNLNLSNLTTHNFWKIYCLQPTLLGVWSLKTFRRKFHVSHRSSCLGEKLRLAYLALLQVHLCQDHLRAVPVLEHSAL